MSQLKDYLIIADTTEALFSTPNVSKAVCSVRREQATLNCGSEPFISCFIGGTDTIAY